MRCFLFSSVLFTFCLSIVEKKDKHHLVARSVITKAMGIWSNFRSNRSQRRRLPLQTQTLLYRSNPTASVLCVPVMGAKKHESFQNKIIRPILQNCLHSIKAPVCLLGIPPMEIFGKKLECQISRQNKTEWSRPDLYCP